MDFSKLKVDVSAKMVSQQRKSQVIEDFNNAVKKGASNTYLVSLLRQTKLELAECNRVLGLLPQDGLSQLSMEWKERHE